MMNDLKEFVRYVIELSEVIKSEEELSSIMLYTQQIPYEYPFYQLLNCGLREKQRKGLKPFFPLLRLILLSLSKLPRYEVYFLCLYKHFK